MPWIAARPKTDPLIPNGCATCADSGERFSAKAMQLNDRPLTAGAAADAIRRRYPRYVTDGPITTHVYPPDQIPRVCGDGAMACAEPHERRIHVARDAEPFAVNHETLHALTSREWRRRVPSAVDEATTEYFNRRMGYYPTRGGVLSPRYEGGQRLLTAYVAANPAREDALARAYFAGDFRALERLDRSTPTPMPRDVDVDVDVDDRPEASLDRRMAAWASLLDRAESAPSSGSATSPARSGAVDAAVNGTR